MHFQERILHQLGSASFLACPSILAAFCTCHCPRRSWTPNPYKLLACLSIFGVGIAESCQNTHSLAWQQRVGWCWVTCSCFFLRRKRCMFWLTAPASPLSALPVLVLLARVLARYLSATLLSMRLERYLLVSGLRMLFCCSRTRNA